MSAANDAERLDRLEENQFFQERLLAELHEALFAQQGEINAISQELRKAKEKIALLEEYLEGMETPQNAKPPHYSGLD